MAALWGFPGGPAVGAAAVGLVVGRFLRLYMDRWLRSRLSQDPTGSSGGGWSQQPLGGKEPESHGALVGQLPGRGRYRVRSRMARGSLQHERAYCRGPLPVVDVTTGLLFAAVAAQAVGWTDLLLGWGLMALSVVATAIDLRVRLIPDAANGLAALWGLVVGLAGYGQGFWPHMATGAGAGLLSALLRWLGRGALGLGDVKMAAVLGLYLGPQAMPTALMAATLLGGGVAAVLLATGKRTRQDDLPFGPFLALGGLVGWFWGEPVAGSQLQ